jgi:hypothetical protein
LGRQKKVSKEKAMTLLAAHAEKTNAKGFGCLFGPGL